MQKPSKRLETVLMLAKLRQQRAAEQLGQMIRNADNQQQQAEQLKHYQLDYGEHFKSLQGQAQSAGQLINYHRFFGNLDQAIESQQQRSVLAGDQCDVARRQWQQLYSREKNMESLIERKQQEEERELEDKLQQVQDDRPRPKLS